MVIHSKDEGIIREFAMKKAVSRLLVNTPGALGGVGATTNLAPALTLGCGAVGKSATSDNITPLNLINIRRVAVGCRSLGDLRSRAETVLGRSGKAPPAVPGKTLPAGGSGEFRGFTREDVESITEMVIARLTSGRP